MSPGLELALKSDQGQGTSNGSSQARGRLAPTVPSSRFLQLVLGASKPKRICCKKVIDRLSLPCPSPCPPHTPALGFIEEGLIGPHSKQTPGRRPGLGVPACNMQVNPDRELLTYDRCRFHQGAAFIPTITNCNQTFPLYTTLWS